MFKIIRKVRELKGFTLLEMIVVIIIIGILMSSLEQLVLKPWFLDGTYYYLTQSFWNLFNINNFNLNWQYPDYWELILWPNKHITLYTYYKDSTSSTWYKKILWNKWKQIVDTVWLNWNKINRWQYIKIKINFLTDNLDDRFHLYLIDLDWSEEKIDDIFNKVCLSNLSGREYCIDKRFYIYKYNW